MIEIDGEVDSQPPKKQILTAVPQNYVSSAVKD